MFAPALFLVLNCHAADVVVADFNRGYAGWQVTGTAFGTEPATGDYVDKLQIPNSPDHSVATSEIHGDEATGSLTSPAFKIERKYITYLIAGGDYEHFNCLNLLVDGKAVRSATGRNSHPLEPGTWDVSEYLGKEARIQIVDDATGGWGHINVDQIIQTDTPAQMPANVMPLYGEPLRPQFHFTGRQFGMNRLNPKEHQEGWVNDLNGLIFYDGEYHLFAQRWGTCWVHAVSKDLIHWKELAPAFWEESLGSGVQSGHCVIDYENTSGLAPDKSTPPMVAFWSRFDQKTFGITYSLDHGRTWRHYAKNPILIKPERDPKVFWYPPTHRWVMVMYGEGQYHILTSPNLLTWTDTHNPIPNSFECPDLFELPIDGRKENKKWVLIQGNGQYSSGTFNGSKFKEESGRRPADVGPNFYATQSWHNTDTGDGRRIQVAWMRGSDFRDMPFNQQISFPCELTLRSTRDGLRIFREPIHEIELLHLRPQKWANIALKAGETRVLEKTGDLFHIKAEVSIPTGAKLTFAIRGIPVILTSQTVESGSPAAPVLNTVKTVEILVDRASIEVFVNQGEISSTRYMQPAEEGISVTAEGGAVQIKSLDIYPLKSAWVGVRS